MGRCLWVDVFKCQDLIILVDDLCGVSPLPILQNRQSTVMGALPGRTSLAPRPLLPARQDAPWGPGAWRRRHLFLRHAARTVAELGIHQHDAETIMRKLDEIEEHHQPRQHHNDVTVRTEYAGASGAGAGADGGGNRDRRRR